MSRTVQGEEVVWGSGMERERARQRGEGESKSVVGRVRDKQVGGGDRERSRAN